MLDDEIKSQLAEYLRLLENDVLIKVSAGTDSASKEMKDLIHELTVLSPKIKTEQAVLSRTPSFSINRIGEDTGVTFAGIPLGHEFTSLVLALLQVGGRPPKIDEKLTARVKALKGEYHFETYASLSCHNCPDVVQALNIMSILNPGITHTMVDGAVFKDEVESRDIMAVPAIYLNGEEFGGGRMVLEDILEKLGEGPDVSRFEEEEPFDVLVVGGGPAGVSAAIYAARKGIRTGIVAEQFGGQVRETLGIENLISVEYAEGPEFADTLERHVRKYGVNIITSKRVKSLKRKEFIEAEMENGAVLRSRTVILSTGAHWKHVGVPGEEKFKTKGVAYCPHCDGPLYKDKKVAVIGGGNSGIEAAIDLAGIASHVTVLEFMPELKADAILKERLYGLPNVTVLKNVQTKEITGANKVDGITYMDRTSGELHHEELQGVFVQIGLIANTDWLAGTVELNRMGEIVVDSRNATSLPGVFAAGDCTDSAYKQIVIAMGAGATAALGAFDYLIRN